MRLRRWPTCFFLLCVCAALPAEAFERVRVSVTYKQKGIPKGGCPDEATFRSLVSARLGYDPFVADGDLLLAVELVKRGSEIDGRLVLRGRDQTPRGERSMHSPAGECLELATSMALAAAVAVDPDAVQKLGTPATSEPPPEPKPVAPAPEPTVPIAPKPEPAPPPPAPASEGASRTTLRLSLAGLIPVGLVPAPRGGARLGAALEWRLWSLGVEGAFLFPSSENSEYGEVTASVLHGSLVPCVVPLNLDRALVELCAVGSLGVLLGDASKVARSEASRDLFATLGPRVATVLMLSEGFGLGVSADIPVTLSRVHLDIEAAGEPHTVWSSSQVGLVGGLSLIARLR